MGVNHEGEHLRNVSNKSHCEEEGATLHVVRLPSWEVFKQGQVSHCSGHIPVDGVMWRGLSNSETQGF